ncbi:unnamed protein product [Lampetra fluviatilis]
MIVPVNGTTSVVSRRCFVPSRRCRETLPFRFFPAERPGNRVGRDFERRRIRPRHVDCKWVGGSAGLRATWLRAAGEKEDKVPRHSGRKGEEGIAPSHARPGHAPESRQPRKRTQSDASLDLSGPAVKRALGRRSSPLTVPSRCPLSGHRHRSPPYDQFRQTS